MLDDQPRIDKQNNSIIKSCPAHPEILLIHHSGIEHIDIEMSVDGIDSFEYGVTFGSLTMPVRREIFCEYLPYCIFHILSFHHQHKISANKVKPFLWKAKEFLRISNKY